MKTYCGSWAFRNSGSYFTLSDIFTEQTRKISNTRIDYENNYRFYALIIIPVTF